MLTFLTRVLVGALVGLGAVLPGISGGVLCVMFGLYKPIIEFLSHPKRSFKKYASMVLPVFLGVAIGFVVVARILEFFLTEYEAVSTCLFIGLIAGEFPSLLKEAGKEGGNRYSWISFGTAAILAFAVLIGVHMFKVSIVPNVGWYIFCGVCMAVSIIVPGMSFSTLLMPLGLYEPFVAGIGKLDFSVMLPGFAAVIIVLITFSKLVDRLFETHYSIAFHAVAGVVLAATIVIIPFDSFTSVTGCIANIAALAVGAVIAYWLSLIVVDKNA